MAGTVPDYASRFLSRKNSAGTVLKQAARNMAKRGRTRSPHRGRRAAEWQAGLS